MRDGPRVWSSMVVKRLEDACAEDLRADGFPEYLTDNEPETEGHEVIPRNRK
ncbi:MAG: 3-hydroxyisobutyrate dehydrogenase [Gammaproteobacteria bacterium]|jgi:3-hydroxyisobutyrate dehydrogenase